MNSRSGTLNSSFRVSNTGRYLSIAGCQINPVVLSIRDHGPAVLDGNFYRNNTDALHRLYPVNNGLRPLSPYKRYLNIMIISVVFLSFSLFTVGFYAWQQKYQVHQLEAELLLLHAAEAERWAGIKS